jgi:hypothetical protein
MDKDNPRRPFSFVIILCRILRINVVVITTVFSCLTSEVIFSAGFQVLNIGVSVEV